MEVPEIRDEENKFEGHNVNIQPLDSITKALFDAFHKYIKNKQAPPWSLRDNLMAMLHYKYDYGFAKLADLFRINKRYVKELIKKHLY